MSAWNRRCGQLTALVLLATVVVSPWAEHSHSRATLWCLNAGGYALALLLLCRVVSRRVGGGRRQEALAGGPSWIGISLASLTVAILGWILVSAVNARSAYEAGAEQLIRFDHWIGWLPHSYDRPATWLAFWQCLALAGVFWATRDWLLEASVGESRGLDRSASGGTGLQRTRLLFWVITLNGGLLATAGLFESWMLGSRAGGGFGPFDYRGNAAQYLNLVWPAALGFWWALRLQERSGDGAGRKLGESPSIFLPLIVAVMAIATVASGSRGGAVVAILMGAVIGGICLRAAWRHKGWERLAGILGLAGSVAVAVWVAGPRLMPRLMVPDLATPLHLASPIGDFVLRLRMNIPPDPQPKFADLAILANRTRVARQSPGALSVYINGKDGLIVRLNAEVGEQYQICGVTRFLSRFAGRKVELEVRREAGGIRVLANGELLAERKADAAGTAAWLRPLAPEWLLHGDLPAGRFARTCDLRSVELEGRPPADTVAWPAGAGLTPELPGGPGGVDGVDGLRVLARVEVPAVPARRLALLRPDDWSGRRELYQVAGGMAAGLPAWLGAGPGSFSNLFRIHCASSGEPYQPHAHNDWLEFRITFGRIGMALLLALLGLATITPLCQSGGTLGPWVVRGIWLALAGCLLHARFDYPLQNSAVVFTFIVLTAICSGSTSQAQDGAGSGLA